MTSQWRRNSQQVQPHKIGNVLIHPNSNIHITHTHDTVLCVVCSLSPNNLFLWCISRDEPNRKVMSGGQNFKKLNIPIMEVGRGYGWRPCFPQVETVPTKWASLLFFLITFLQLFKPRPTNFIILNPFTYVSHLTSVAPFQNSHTIPSYFVSLFSPSFSTFNTQILLQLIKLCFPIFLPSIFQSLLYRYGRGRPLVFLTETYLAVRDLVYLTEIQNTWLRWRGRRSTWPRRPTPGKLDRRLTHITPNAQIKVSRTRRIPIHHPFNLTDRRNNPYSLYRFSIFFT